jgi:hypothetical protein
MRLAREDRKPRKRNPSRAAVTLCGFLAAATWSLGLGAARAEEAGPSAATAVSSAQAKGSVFVDPLGFLLFGPTLGAELGFGQYSVLGYGRWLDGGLLAKSLFESSTDKFTFSYGAGLKGRHYFGQGLVGPHVGVAFEALKTRTESRTDRVATNNLVLVPEIEGGYRFGFGSFFVGATLGVGYALQVSSSIDNINGGNQAGNYKAKNVSTIYGSANLDVGLLF